MLDNKDQIVENLQKDVEELKCIVEMQNDIIRDLRERFCKNSGNSSKPPSTDGLKKKPVNKNKSLREKSGKKRGCIYRSDCSLCTVFFPTFAAPAHGLYPHICQKPPIFNCFKDYS